MANPFTLESKATALTALTEAFETRYLKLIAENEVDPESRDECARLIYAIMNMAESIAEDVDNLVSGLDFCDTIYGKSIA